MIFPSKLEACDHFLGHLLSLQAHPLAAGSDSAKDQTWLASFMMSWKTQKSLILDRCLFGDVLEDEKKGYEIPQNNHAQHEDEDSGVEGEGEDVVDEADGEMEKMDSSTGAVEEGIDEIEIVFEETNEANE